MTDRPRIRIASMDDYSEIRRLLRDLDELHVRIRPDVFQSFDDQVQQRERIEQIINNHNSDLFAAEIGSNFIGLATVRVASNPDAPMFRPSRRACMDDLVVSTKFRRLGIAQMLVDHVAEWAASRELPSLGINVWNSNHDGVSFFESYGFKPRCQQMEIQISSTTRPK